jgi:endogenous inhibitor of DNA gyrase (YacG/DUF329 family)
VIKRLACPICKKRTFWTGNPHRPFCSERCRMADLASWIGEAYAIAGESAGQPFTNRERQSGAGESDRDEDWPFLVAIAREPRGSADLFTRWEGHRRHQGREGTLE